MYRELLHRTFGPLSGVEKLLLFVSFSAVVFFSTYQLFESPETWMDEGFVIQSAQGLLEVGTMALPISPNEYEPAWYLTTGFPLLIPLAVAFGVFGVSLEIARVVMVAFILVFFILAWLYARLHIGKMAGWFGFLLLVSFAPLYGNGRNALGEVPGLVFILLALLPLLFEGSLTYKKTIWIGIFAGLAAATKPIFLLFILALFVVVLLRRKELGLSVPIFFVGSFFVFIPLVAGAAIQFGPTNILQILTLYANPHHLDLGSTVLANAKRLVTELQPLYFLTAIVIWAASYIARRVRRESVSAVEETLLFFSIFTLAAYMRTAGYYRYFFLGEVFTLLYLPQSLWFLVKDRSAFFARGIIVALIALISYQLYETTFHSWIATHYSSTRTATLKNYFAELPLNTETFIYQAPEVVSFVGSHPFKQFAQAVPLVYAGEKYQRLVLNGTAPKVITSQDFFEPRRGDVFSHYDVSQKIDGYVILVPKSR
jgi:hypothetical protein